MTDTVDTQAISTASDRLRAIEDRLEIHELLTAHAPAIDSGATDYWIERWTEDSWVDRPADPEQHSGDFSGRYGRSDLRKEIDSPELEALRQTGLCHLNTAPVIRVDGDTATAINYTTLISLEDFTAYRIRVVVVNDWTLRREGGWKITSRTIRPVGDPAARAILLQGITGK